MVAQPYVAKVWWEAPHADGGHRLVSASDVLLFGRAADADVRWGFLPVPDVRVPRSWGRLAWPGGELLVTNTDETWGFDVVSRSASGHERRATVRTGEGYRPPFADVTLEARLGPGSAYGLRVFTRPAAAPAGLPVSDLDPTWTPSLSDDERRVAAAVIAPLGRGGVRRASYTEVAAATYFERTAVRNRVERIDAVFVTHGLADPTVGDALDRVAAVVQRHPGLLGPSR